MKNMLNDDLISRTALLNDLSYCAPELWQDEEYVKAKIMKQPAVDAVPVVRCKDCKYAHLTDDDECKYCDMISALTDEGDPIMFQYFPPDWYCADGER